MEVKIGVQHASRELTIDSDLESAELEKAIEAALTGSSPVLTLTDSKGRKVIVPADKLAFIEVGSPAVGQVGFRS
jgi:predicted transcriptional regulator